MEVNPLRVGSVQQGCQGPGPSFPTDSPGDGPTRPLSTDGGRQRPWCALPVARHKLLKSSYLGYVQKP